MPRRWHARSTVRCAKTLLPMIVSGPLGGQGKPWSNFYPPIEIKVVARNTRLYRTPTLGKTDAAVVVFERDGIRPEFARPVAAGRSLAGPAAQGDQGRGQEHPDARSHACQTRRHTLVVIGFVKQNASGYERLDLAGKLLREALPAGRDDTLQLHAPGMDRRVTNRGSRSPAERSACRGCTDAGDQVESDACTHSRPHRDLSTRQLPSFDRSIAVACWQSPRAVADGAAAERAGCAGLSQGAAADRASRGLVVPFLRCCRTRET